MQKAEHLLFSQMLSFTVPFFSEWCSFRWKFANRNSDTHWIPEFLVGAGGFASRAEKEPESRLPAAASCLGRHAHPAGRSPNSSSLFLPLAAVVAVAQGLFYPPDYSAGRCCSNPPLCPFCLADKTETPAPIGYRSSWWARVDSNHRS